MKSLLAALVTVGALVGIAPSAHAQADDRRPCVSLREWQQFGHLDSSLTKYELETLWEVHGLGTFGDDASPTVTFTRIYPTCGYNTGYVQIAYRLNTRDMASGFRYVPADAKLHGKP